MTLQELVNQIDAASQTIMVADSMNIFDSLYGLTPMAFSRPHSLTDQRTRSVSVITDTLSWLFQPVPAI